MLQTLSIRDMVLIEAADLVFRPGLNVLTGETGAGKSILLDALGFVLGWRGRGGTVRSGAAQGEVTASFEIGPDHPARATLESAGLTAEAELILRRTTTPEGRRQAFVNDRRVAAETLRALSESLVELHGQQDDRGLLDPRGHRALLDAFAGTGPALAQTRAAWAERARAMGALDAARTALETDARDADYLAHAAAELEALDVQAGEEPDLDSRRRQLQAAERIRADIIHAAEALGPDGAEGPLIQALRWLEAAAPSAEGALDPALDGLARVLDALAETASEVEAVRGVLDSDPGEVERVEERLFAIRGLARKHQVLPDELPDLTADLRARLGALEQRTGDLPRLEAEVTAAGARFATAAAALSALRRDAAGRLDAQMAGELAPLKLERAVFLTEVTPGDPGPEGVDRVSFSVATAPGAAPGPIGRIASGGELSRFLLALKVCLSVRAEGVTLIFDEIDRGVGGATADAVGRRLQEIGTRAQVLVVTHSPQVAARGAHHWLVGKTLSGTTARTEVRQLDEGARLEEIARMLAGDTVTDAARAAALALVAG
jgi:DNA repair protein RecN (Recombination protein N)